MLPRHAGDALPRTPAGILVAVADRLDSLVGLFAAGAAPSASADPFALRRSAYGMLEVFSFFPSVQCGSVSTTEWIKASLLTVHVRASQIAKFPSRMY